MTFCILTFAIFVAAQTKGVNLKFVNQTNYPASIYWVEAGKEKLYKTLNASENYSQSTFANHQWRVRLNGKLVGSYVATTAPLQEIEISVGKSESPGTIKTQKDAEKNCDTVAKFLGVAWIGKWGSMGEGQLSYCEFGSLRASNLDETKLKKVSVNFVNKTKAPVLFFWVDNSGKEKYYGTLDAGSSLKQSTYATHIWKFKLANGRNIGEYVAAEQSSQEIEIAYYMGEVKQIRSQKEAEQQCTKLAGAKGGIWTGKWSELGDANAPFCELVRLRSGKEQN